MRIIIYWHIFHSCGFHHICNIECKLDCRYSPQNIFNTKNFNPHKKPISLLNVPICTHGIQLTWWPEAGTIIVTGPYGVKFRYGVVLWLLHGILKYSFQQNSEMAAETDKLTGWVKCCKWHTYPLLNYANDACIYTTCIITIWCIGLSHSIILNLQSCWSEYPLEYTPLCEVWLYRVHFKQRNRGHTYPSSKLIRVHRKEH